MLQYVDSPIKKRFYVDWCGEINFNNWNLEDGIPFFTCHFLPLDEEADTLYLQCIYYPPCNGGCPKAVGLKELSLGHSPQV
jgi:hypothetical protein